RSGKNTSKVSGDFGTFMLWSSTSSNVHIDTRGKPKQVLPWRTITSNCGCLVDIEQYRLAIEDHVITFTEIHSEPLAYGSQLNRHFVQVLIPGAGTCLHYGVRAEQPNTVILVSEESPNPQSVFIAFLFWNKTLYHKV